MDGFPQQGSLDLPREQLQRREHLDPFIGAVQEAEHRHWAEGVAQAFITAMPQFERDRQPHAEESQAVEEINQRKIWAMHSLSGDPGTLRLSDTSRRIFIISTCGINFKC